MTDQAIHDALREKLNDETFYGRVFGKNLIDNLCRHLAPAVAALLRQREEWKCFHCGEEFADDQSAREHFGTDQYKTPACRLSTEDVAVLRQLEADNDALRRENEKLDNDSRLWHESEADRVRRIGNVQWWQELDSRVGEILALRQREETLLAKAGALLRAVDALANLPVRTSIVGKQIKLDDSNLVIQRVIGEADWFKRKIAQAPTAEPTETICEECQGSGLPTELSSTCPRCAGTGRTSERKQSDKMDEHGSR